MCIRDRGKRLARCVLAFDRLAHHDQTSRICPALCLIRDLSQYKPGFQRPPARIAQDGLLQRLREFGADDVVDLLAFEPVQDGRIIEPAGGAEQPDHLVAEMVQGRFDELQDVVRRVPVGKRKSGFLGSSCI